MNKNNINNNNDIIIKIMKKCHVPMVLAVENACFSIPWTKNSFLEEMDNHLAVYYIALLSDKVIGYVGMWEIGNEGHITNIAVHPDYQRRKVGSRLLETLKKRAESQGISSLTLEVRASNEPAICLYQKYQFEIKGRRKGYYSDNGEDAYIMWYVKS